MKRSQCDKSTPYTGLVFPNQIGNWMLKKYCIQDLYKWCIDYKYIFLNLIIYKYFFKCLSSSIVLHTLTVCIKLNRIILCFVLNLRKSKRLHTLEEHPAQCKYPEEDVMISIDESPLSPTWSLCMQT